MKWLLLMVLLLLWSSPVLSVVAVDTSTSANCLGCTNYSWNHTVSGTNRLLIVSTANTTASTPATSTMTYNSVSMTAANLFSITTHEMDTFYLTGPATGTHSVAVTLSATASSSGGSASFTGVSQTTPLGTMEDGSYTDITTGITITVPTNGMAISVAFNSTACDTLSPDTGQTQVWNECAGAATISSLGSTRSTSGSFNWVGTPTGYNGIQGYPINPVTATVAIRHRPIMQ